MGSLLLTPWATGKREPRGELQTPTGRSPGVLGERLLAIPISVDLNAFFQGMDPISWSRKGC